MDYAIVTTLGPSSADPATWQALLAAGATGFRLNTSHLDLDQLYAWLERLEPFLAEHNPAPALVLDLQGSKWRLGDFTPWELSDGQRVDLIHAARTGRARTLPVPHPDFFRAAPHSGGEIVLNDSRVRLRLENCGRDEARARVTLAGPLAPRKGITFSASGYRLEALSEKDRTILEAARSLPGVRYALSYLRDAVEMARYRELCGPQAYLIAKLERRPALEAAREIAGLAEELWLCRGDLGAELGVAEMAEAVHDFSPLAFALPVPTLMAGQVFEHMAASPTPTRSEVCYLYDTLQKGYQGVVLSDETAVGRYPVESCRAAALFKTH